MDTPHQIETVTTVTAKVLVVGDSGVGKTALLHRLRDEAFTPTASTHGASLSRIRLPSNLVDSDPTVTVAADLEIWDLAGQPDYNAVHQIFMHDACLAVVVIDECQGDGLASVQHWTSFVRRHCQDLHAIVLVSARIDRGILQSNALITKEAQAQGIATFVRTSALRGHGIGELRSALFRSIDWSRLTRTVRPAHWHAIWTSILDLASCLPPVVTPTVIRERVHDCPEEELTTILTLMDARGVLFIMRPEPDCTLVLLRPELLNHYANSVVLAARTNVAEQGLLNEATVLRAGIDLRGIERLAPGDERLILDAVVSLLVGSGACYRNNGSLVFPNERGPKQLKCFLSHNSADKATAEDLARRLLDSGVDVWLDKWEILAGESLTSSIEVGIDDADAFIILMSPNSMKAKWVKEELRIAIQRRLDNTGFRLIPVLLEDCSRPGFLRDYVYVDWRSPDEQTFEYLLNSLRGKKGKPERGPNNRVHDAHR